LLREAYLIRYVRRNQLSTLWECQQIEHIKTINISITVSKTGLPCSLRLRRSGSFQGSSYGPPGVLLRASRGPPTGLLGSSYGPPGVLLRASWGPPTALQGSSSRPPSGPPSSGPSRFPSSPPGDTCGRSFQASFREASEGSPQGVGYPSEELPDESLGRLPAGSPAGSLVDVPQNAGGTSNGVPGCILLSLTGRPGGLQWPSAGAPADLHAPGSGPPGALQKSGSVFRSRFLPEDFLRVSFGASFGASFHASLPASLPLSARASLPASTRRGLQRASKGPPEKPSKKKWQWFLS